MPNLIIKIDGEPIGSIPMDSIKKAKIYVEELNPKYNESFTYKTINEITRVENTVEIKPKLT